MQQIRRISLAQVLCRTLDAIDSVQPFVFLSPDNPDNERIPCHNGLLNNFDLSPWIEINSNDDIKKSDDNPTTTPKPKTNKPTITNRPTTDKGPKLPSTPNKNPPNRPTTTNKPAKPHKASHRLNGTDSHTDNSTVNRPTTSTTSKPKTTVQAIDDKLDFKNKSRRYSDFESILTRYRKPTTQYSGYDYDDAHSVQSLVVNNLQHKRPYNRPVITVTENIDKYTYLINYVPRPTQSWRQSTRKTHDRDVVKVTYQTYDDTYDRRHNRPYYHDSRRPNNPYYNRHDPYENSDYKRERPDVKVTNDANSSARSNDHENNSDKRNTNNVTDKRVTTTETNSRLSTFSYVGTYRRDNGQRTDDKHDTDSLARLESVSKDFTTFETKQHTVAKEVTVNTDKISTFYQYETSTRPYNPNRPTRLNDEEQIATSSKHKYYYVRNVLHKYPDDATITKRGAVGNIEAANNSHNSRHPSAGIEERSVANKMHSLAALDTKTVNADRPRLNVKKPSAPAKTSSVAFQIIPSENR